MHKAEKKHVEHSTLKEGVLQQITSGDVEVRPRWHFVLRNSLLWLAGTMLLVIGALSVSIVIFLLRGQPWEMRQIFGMSLPQFYLQAFPFLWFGVYFFFLIVAEIVIRRTKGTYRYSPLRLSLVILVASVVLGSIFYFLKISHGIDDALGKHTPRMYKTLDQRRDGLMHRPEKGRIMGIVQSVDLSGNPQTFVIMHPRGDRQRTVQIDGRLLEKISLIRVGARLHVLGKPIGDDAFRAFDIHLSTDTKKKVRKMIR